MSVVEVSLAVEGLLDEQVLQTLIDRLRVPLRPVVCYGKRGKDHLWQNVPRFNQAAAHSRPFIVLADLDDAECAPALIESHLPEGLHSRLMLRIAVREVESWLLADRENFAAFLGIPVARIPVAPDNELTPKQVVVDLARRSRKKTIREELVPAPMSTSKVGKNYVGRLDEFVTSLWDVKTASDHSPSLAHTVTALETFADKLR